jgi:ornithine carbamoyltransferase
MELKGKSFLKLLDFTPEEIGYLLELSAKLKQEKSLHSSLMATFCSQ